MAGGLVSLNSTGSRLRPVITAGVSAFTVISSTFISTALDSITGGSLALYPGSSVSGVFNYVNGSQLYLGGSDALIAKEAMTTMYNDTVSRRSASTTQLNGNYLSNWTFKGGLHKSGADTLYVSNPIYFDAEGDSSTTFIVVVDGSMELSAYTNVLLLNGAMASNIYWVTTAYASIGAHSSFKGTLLSNSSIVSDSGVTVEGRLLSRVSVTMSNNLLMLPLSSESPSDYLDPRCACLPAHCLTEAPTSSPTAFPSGVPTAFPSGVPTGVPTGEPTSVPTGKPSSDPSGYPSGQPSGEPSGMPSGEPTSDPSVLPSGDPSCEPSGEPSGMPIGEPTSVPSDEPTSDPSVEPSGQPSGEPSGMPSGGPSG